ncbi:hypothetical protein [Poriferisphaera sp. WC338]|uniref:hypothetical protein n=1 Tax=Poriferisphaera sp. WC338 TaxID=3425129 RepID=UPI003D8161E4
MGRRQRQTASFRKKSRNGKQKAAGEVVPSKRDSLAGLMMAYAMQPGERQRESLWAFIRDRNPYVFSHHPSDKCFEEHVWNFGGMYFCKGCVMTFSGVMAGLVLQLVVGWLGMMEGVWETWGVASVFVGMLLPTVVLGALGGPRWMKHVGRFLLGVLVASAFCMLFVTGHWWVRGVVIAMFFLVKIPMERLRRKQNRTTRQGSGAHHKEAVL